MYTSVVSLPVIVTAAMAAMLVVEFQEALVAVYCCCMGGNPENVIFKALGSVKI